MAVKTRDEILASIKSKFADDTSDETLAFIEDVSDTFDDLTNRAGDGTNWKQKYEANDAEWRKKYRDRFFKGSGSDGDDDSGGNDDDGNDEEKPLTYENLFKIETR